MREYFKKYIDYEYSIDSFGRKSINEEIVGNLYDSNNGCYITVIKFKDDNRDKNIKIEKVILNIYVSWLRGTTILPIEVINYNTLKSKVFLLSGTSVGKYNKLDITSIYDTNNGIEFKIKSLKTKKGAVALNNIQNEYKAILEIGYEKDMSNELCESNITEHIINEINETVESKRTEGDKEGVELYTIVKCLYNYFSEEIVDLKDKIKALERQASKNNTIEVTENIDEHLLLKKQENNIKNKIRSLGFFMIKELVETNIKKVNSISFVPEILEDINLDKKNNKIIIENEGVYSIRCNVEITGMALAIPNLLVKVNDEEIGCSKKGVAVPHQTLTLEVMKKLNRQDNIKIVLRDVNKNTMVCGSIIVTKEK